MVLRMSGQVVLADRYRLDHQLGSGGMGTVWSGYDLRLHRAVAIKQAAEHNTAPAGARRRLRQEAAALGILSEAHIARVYDFLESGDDAYIVMELVDGENLSARLKREQRLSATEAARIAAHCAWGLHAAHRSGVVHRDIKPSNIMFTADGNVKIVDFGIASRIQAVDALTQEMTTDTFNAGAAGTAAYFAPERAHGAPGSPAADLYSLGVVLYQMLAGRLPFRAEEPLAMLLAHATATPEPLPEDVPPALTALCMQLLAKNPADRPASGALIASHLRSADLARRTEAATFVSTASIGAQPARPRRVLKHRSAILTSAPLAVLLTTATILSVAAAQRPIDGSNHSHTGQPPSSSSASSAAASQPAVLLAQTTGSSAPATTGFRHTTKAAATPSAPVTSPRASVTKGAAGSPSASTPAATTAPSSSPSASHSAAGSSPSSTGVSLSSASPSAD
jgi:serine/threonine protein kinase